MFFILISFCFYSRFPNIATFSILEQFAGKIKRGKELTSAFQKIVKQCLSTNKPRLSEFEPFPIAIASDDVKDCFDLLREKHKEHFKKGMDLFIINIKTVRKRNIDIISSKCQKCCDTKLIYSR